MKPICAKCKKFFRPKKNDFIFEEGMPIRQDDGSDVWQAYKLWSGDLWECKGCGAEIVVGIAPQPIAEHFREDDYRKWLEACPPQFRVEDC